MERIIEGRQSEKILLLHMMMQLRENNFGKIEPMILLNITFEYYKKGYNCLICIQLYLNSQYY